MSTTRRDFIKTTGGPPPRRWRRAGRFGFEPAAQTPPPTGADPFALELAMKALNAAKTPAPLYADDVRVGRYPQPVHHDA